MARLIVILLTFLLFTGGTQFSSLSANQAAETQDEIDLLFRAAQSAFSKGDYPTAVQKYERLALLQPNSAEGLSNLGVAYHMTGQIPKSVDTLQKALHLDPDLLPANLILGIDFVQLGKAERAVPPLQKVLQLDPANRDALLTLASAYFSLQEFDQAAEVYRQETTIRPPDADAWYGLGLCFEHIAEATGKGLSQVGKNSAYYHRLLGEFLIEENAAIDAEEAFRRALALAAEDNEGLHAGLGFAHLRLGEILQAGEEFKMELQLHAGNLEAELGEAAIAMEEADFATGLANLCSIYGTNKGYFQTRLNFFLASLGDQTQLKLVEYLRASAPAGCSPVADLLWKELTSPQSIVEFRSAFEPLVSKFGDALLLARRSCLSGRFLAAFQAAKVATDKEPQKVSAYYWRAEAAKKLAQAAFQQAVRLDPNSWQGHILLGDIYRQRKNWNLATSHYQAAAQLKPSSPAPFLGLATIYWQNGQNDRAEVALRKVLELDSDNAQANFELGNILVRQHRFEEAVAHLKKNLTYNPDLLAAHADLGQAYSALGKLEQATAELIRALPMDRYGDLHYQLYMLYTKQGQTELAQQALEESQILRARELKNHQRRLERAESGVTLK
jgi:tetratricopeptide (TPR) repeat protein